MRYISDIMDYDRPYLSNYATGILIVMGFHMGVNFCSVILFPEWYQSSRFSSSFFMAVFGAVTAWELILALGLFLRSGLAHKLSILSMVLIVVLITANILIGGTIGFDIMFQIVLAIAVLVLILTPSLREYYRGWSLGKIPSNLIKQKGSTE